MIPLLAEELMAVSAVYALFSIVLQRKLINIDKMYEIRAKTNEGTKQLQELIKNNASQQEISDKQKEIMSVSMESMKLQFKPLVVIFPIFLVLYYVVLPIHFNFSSTLTILSFTISYRVFFIICLFVLGIVFSTVFSMYDRRRLKDKYNFGLMQPSFKQNAPTVPNQQ